MLKLENAREAFMDYQNYRYKTGQISERTYRDLQSQTEALIDWIGGDTPMSDIDKNQFKNNLENNRGYSTRTANDYQSLLSRLENFPTYDQVSDLIEAARS